MTEIEELKHEVKVKEAELGAVDAALKEVEKAHNAVLKQYEDARDALNAAKAAYIEALA